ncbi:hypothetical protein CALCODRAFT_556675 [Calocera cornea HHB12733]|uniref:Uncharacterized protein n=1 Tax=Calocera cornea HHB12733 TaxID=1353952 RepID=A0A165EHY5_9BASI|nr:hypothetical protein CALCODRAFT_556675 [Calocera cornea HHB12733]
MTPFAIGVLLASAASVLAQCTYTALLPDFYGSSEVVYVGDRLFDADGDSSSCIAESGLITGQVYLYRPGDFSFVPRVVGYWNGLNSSDPNNTIFAPDVSPKGYGYRVVIVPDRNSPSREPQYSNTFPIVSQAWFDESYDQVFLWEPTSAYDTTSWSSTGQQLLAFQDNNNKFAEFDVLLYKASDVTWGPLHLAHVTSASCPTGSCAATEFYFEYPGKLPLGSGYQVVLQTSVDNKAQVISDSGLITIVDYPVTTNTFPFTWTPIKTITNEPTGK